MANVIKKKSILQDILKFIGGILLAIVVLLIAGYCFLRFSLGIDIIDVKHKIDLLKINVNEQTYITNLYTNTQAQEALTLMFGNDNEILIDDVFDYEKFLNSPLQADTSLMDNQFASLVNFYMKSENDVFEDNNFLTLKQINFESLENQGTTSTIKITQISKVDFSSLKNSLTSNGNQTISNLVYGLFPENIYLKTSFSVNINTEDFSFSWTKNYFQINNISYEESNGIAQIFDILTGNEKGSFVNNYFKLAVKGLFGDNESNGLVNIINGCNGFVFENSGEKIVITLKKA